LANFATDSYSFVATVRRSPCAKRCSISTVVNSNAGARQLCLGSHRRKHGERCFYPITQSAGCIIDGCRAVCARNGVFKQECAESLIGWRRDVGPSPFLPPKSQHGRHDICADFQVTLTLPEDAESAPCFAALVASSWTTKAKDCAALGLSSTKGPLMEIFPAKLAS
jgi:hypothetical protein